MTEKRGLVTAVFRDRVDAERAFDYLHARGYSDSEINVLTSDRTRTAFYPEQSRSSDGEKHEAGTLAQEGMGVGGAIGTAVGVALGAVLAVGTSIAIPGLGLIIAGPIAAGLAGGGAGAITGGALGLLIGAGMTESNAAAYEAALRSGGIVLGVVPHDRSDARDIQNKFKELNGENVCYC